MERSRLGKLVIEDVAFGHTVCSEDFDGRINHTGAATKIGLMSREIAAEAIDRLGDPASFAIPFRLRSGDNGGKFEAGQSAFEFVKEIEVKELVHIVSAEKVVGLAVDAFVFHLMKQALDWRHAGATGNHDHGSICVRETKFAVRTVKTNCIARL